MNYRDNLKTIENKFRMFFEDKTRKEFGFTNSNCCPKANDNSEWEKKNIFNN